MGIGARTPAGRRGLCFSWLKTRHAAAIWTTWSSFTTKLAHLDYYSSTAAEWHAWLGADLAMTPWMNSKIHVSNQESALPAMLERVEGRTRWLTVSNAATQYENRRMSSCSGRFGQLHINSLAITLSVRGVSVVKEGKGDQKQGCRLDWWTGRW